jgi:hypothetical protein
VARQWPAPGGVEDTALAPHPDAAFGCVGPTCEGEV